MSEVLPIEESEELQGQPELADLNLTPDQNAVDSVAVDVMKAKPVEGKKLKDCVVTLIDSSLSENAEKVAELALSPILGNQYVFSKETVKKLLIFLSMNVGRKASKAERKEQRQKEIAEAKERKRAVLRRLRNFLKKDDMEDHRAFLRAVKNLSKEDQIELRKALQEMRDDWRLFEGMDTLHKGRIEEDLRGEEPTDPKSP